MAGCEGPEGLVGRAPPLVMHLLAVIEVLDGVEC